MLFVQYLSGFFLCVVTSGFLCRFFLGFLFLCRIVIFSRVFRVEKQDLDQPKGTCKQLEQNVYKIKTRSKSTLLNKIIANGNKLFCLFNTSLIGVKYEKYSQHKKKKIEYDIFVGIMGNAQLCLTHQLMEDIDYIIYLQQQ